MNNIDIKKVVDIAKKAGDAVLKIYNSSDFQIESKDDSSPLTRADEAAHSIIVEGLSELTPQLPCISEESGLPDWPTRQTYRSYWLIDPLDGTKEFIKRNDEFTINIALISEHDPVLGVVFAPAKNVMFYGEREGGAFKKVGEADPKEIRVTETSSSLWRIVGSRSHQTDEFKDFVAQFSRSEVISMGSSLKLCLVAAGEADLYPRLGPTSEWDTAAAHALVEAAGGQVLSVESGKALKYNAKESLLNPFFIACAKPESPWYENMRPSRNTVWHKMTVDKQARAARANQKPVIIWFTGLSGSGKSTSASALEKHLFSMGYNTYLLDGDNVRHGLCSDLGFSDRDRGENIRRLGEVAKLMVDAGFIVLTSFISPFTRERQMVRQMVEPGEFVEVYMNTPLEECEKRDPKGLYKKARSGAIKRFTGIDSPYEAPKDAEIEVDTTCDSIDDVVEHLVLMLKARGLIRDH